MIRPVKSDMPVCRKNHFESLNNFSIQTFIVPGRKMRIIVTYLLLFYSGQLFGQHSDTVHMGRNTVVLTAYDDDKIINEGDLLLDQNRIKEAIAKYTIVVKLSPTNITAISDRACAYLQLDDYRRSLNDYNTAIALDTADYINLSNRALVKWYFKDYYGAVNDCDKALAFKADYAYAWFHKGISYFELNNYKEAINSYDKAIQIDPDFTRAFYNRGNAKFESKDLPGACSDWQRAKALGHKTADTMIEKHCK